MFDMTALVTRYFELKLPNGMELNVKPPKMKTLKNILKLSKTMKSIRAVEGEVGDEAIGSLTEALSLSLSNNKEDVKISADELNEMMDLLQMMELFTAYYNWVGDINSSKN